MRGGHDPVSPASYPVTIQLFNNATVNAQNRTQVAYGYWIDEAGTGKIFTGVSDTVVFNNPSAPGHAPANKPGFSINGFSSAHALLLRDAEIVLVGGIGGDNAVFRSLSGTINLEYSNLSSGGWENVPSAYNFGGDTGETSTGIADYWTAGHTLAINQGPAMLYGLWNAVPSVSVASGDIQLAGTVSPSYGFVFVSNTPPVANPFALHAAPDNMSWLPTSNDWSFDTFLPPLGGPWTTEYYVQGFAAGSKETNGTPVTLSVSSYALVLPLSPGSLEAPLYMFSNAQAAGLALAVTGESSVPLNFTNLTVNINASFDHLNEYGYPSFELVMSQGVSTAIHVNNIVQGEDSGLGNLYISDVSGTGLISPAPLVVGPRPNYTSQINIYGGVGDQVTRETLTGSGGQGGAVVLWKDQDARVADITSKSDVIRSLRGRFDRHGREECFRGERIRDRGHRLDAHDRLYPQRVRRVRNRSLQQLEQLFLVDQRHRWRRHLLRGGRWDTLLRSSRNAGPLRDQPLRHRRGIGAEIVLSNDTTFTTVTVTNSVAGIAEDQTDVTEIQSLTANNSQVGAYLNDTNWTNFTGLRATGDLYGVLMLNGSGNGIITGSTFTDCMVYAIEIYSGQGNLVYNNWFVGNDGSTQTYSASNIQVYSAAGNDFSFATDVGNYWADWHSLKSPGVTQPLPDLKRGLGPVPALRGTSVPHDNVPGVGASGRCKVMVGGLCRPDQQDDRRTEGQHHPVHHVQSTERHLVVPFLGTGGLSGHPGPGQRRFHGERSEPPVAGAVREGSDARPHVPRGRSSDRDELVRDDRRPVLLEDAERRPQEPDPGSFRVRPRGV